MLLVLLICYFCCRFHNFIFRCSFNQENLKLHVILQWSFNQEKWNWNFTSFFNDHSIGKLSTQFTPERESITVGSLVHPGFGPLRPCILPVGTPPRTRESKRTRLLFKGGPYWSKWTKPRTWVTCAPLIYVSLAHASKIGRISDHYRNRQETQIPPLLSVSV